jgi:membrane associated rhomboid family serine protease
MFKIIKYNSPVILTFTFLSLFALILGYATQGYSTSLLFSVYKSSPKSLFFYIRLFGHILGHANWSHFFNNFLIILLVGPMLEEKYSSKKLLIMILFTAFVTGLINLAFFNTGLLGASGIAFMLILLSSFVNLEKGTVPVTFVLVFLAYIGSEVVSGFVGSDNTSQLTHIVGGVCGGIFGYFLNKEKFTTKTE